MRVRVCMVQYMLGLDIALFYLYSFSFLSLSLSLVYTHSFVIYGMYIIYSLLLMDNARTRNTVCFLIIAVQRFYCKCVCVCTRQKKKKKQRKTDKISILTNDPSLFTDK